MNLAATRTWLSSKPGHIMRWAVASCSGLLRVFLLSLVRTGTLIIKTICLWRIFVVDRNLDQIEIISQFILLCLNI